MPEHCGTIGTDGIEMPQAMNLSSERLTRSGLFMLEDGQNIFLWIGREAVPQLCMDLFGVPNYESVRGGKVFFLRATLTTYTRSKGRVNLFINISNVFLSFFPDDSPSVGI